MRSQFQALLECPFCGAPLTLVATHPALRRDAERITAGVLSCECCAFPIVDGIPVLRADPLARSLLAALDACDMATARRLLLELDECGARAMDALEARAGGGTFHEALTLLGPDAERTYFAHRFADPTFLVSDGVVQAAASVTEAFRHRTIDICGGAGHLTWRLAQLARARGAAPPILADYVPWKLWLASRFVVPEADVVSIDANAPLPFPAGCASLVVCSDAFHYIWTRRLLAGEMRRLAGADGVLVLTHLHNLFVYNPSAGMPLSPAAYAHLADGVGGQLFADSRLRDDLVERNRVDWSAPWSSAALAGEPSLTIVAGPAALYASHHVRHEPTGYGKLCINPLYRPSTVNGCVRLDLTFPSDDYAQEFGAVAGYMPQHVELRASSLSDLAALVRQDPELFRQRVVLEIPLLC